MAQESFDDVEIINLDKLEESTMCACSAGDAAPWL